MFCPKCGSILIPKKDGKKVVVSCSCGYRTGKAQAHTISEKSERAAEIPVIESERESLPKMTIECPKCSFNEAYYWTQQTRAADEPETKFLRCVKCKHVWRDYS